MQLGVVDENMPRTKLKIKYRVSKDKLAFSKALCCFNEHMIITLRNLRLEGKIMVTRSL